MGNETFYGDGLTVTTAPVGTLSRTYSTTSRIKVALKVVPVKIMSKGDSVTTYALLDNGSEQAFLSKARLFVISFIS